LRKSHNLKTQIFNTIYLDERLNPAMCAEFRPGCGQRIG